MKFCVERKVLLKSVAVMTIFDTINVGKAYDYINCVVDLSFVKSKSRE